MKTKAIKTMYVTSTNTDDLQKKVNELLEEYRDIEKYFYPKLLPLVIAPKGFIQPVVIYE